MIPETENQHARISLRGVLRVTLRRANNVGFLNSLVNNIFSADVATFHLSPKNVLRCIAYVQEMFIKL